MTILTETGQTNSFIKYRGFFNLGLFRDYIWEGSLQHCPNEAWMVPVRLQMQAN